MAISKEFRHLIICGLILRLLLVAYSVFHDNYFRIKYTDIDYSIVVNGAEDMVNGKPIYLGTTFRYTPLLAVLMLPAVYIASPMGKIVLIAADLGAAIYCYLFLRFYATEKSTRQMVSIFILFNPIVLNVSSRGNSDMLLTLMTMFVLHSFQEKKYYRAAAMLGFSIHFKIYPVIYALPLGFGLYESFTGEKNLFRRFALVSEKALFCGVICFICFAIPTFLCYLAYGMPYINEAFLYHASREDHRHNFSPYWLLMYLKMGEKAISTETVHSTGYLAFIPQMVVLLFVSWKLRRNVAHACGVITVFFIAFNKVCTVQYFVWFIPFLSFIFCKPLEIPSAEEGNAARKSKGEKQRNGPPSILRVILVFFVWQCTIPLWMITAIKLEFEGRNVFGQLYGVSCIFFLATVCLGSWLARVSRASQLRRLEMLGSRANMAKKLN